MGKLRAGIREDVGAPARCPFLLSIAALRHVESAAGERRGDPEGSGHSRHFGSARASAHPGAGIVRAARDGRLAGPAPDPELRPRPPRLLPAPRSGRAAASGLDIAICYTYIAISDMTLGEKLRHLRTAEGTLRGLGRAMTQTEVMRAIRRETGGAISQSYLSQIERGSRRHLTHETRTRLARFFKVHPGYLVSDPPGYHEELRSELKAREDSMDVWLMQGAERFRDDPRLQRALLGLAAQEDSRRWLLLLGDILRRPATAQRFRELMEPSERAGGAPRQRTASRR